MPVRNYRERQGNAQGLQYDGTNKQEMLDFAPGFVTDVDGTLMIVKSPFPLATTEWVIKTERSEYRRLNNADFNVFWEPGA